jgi:glycosyltransferase involved in cell wall biosynthesis
VEPAVSIITPTYNHARYIGACLESVLAQTMSGWEMIVIDDASTDGTGDVVARYPDPRIRYLRQEHAGLERLAETYNRALALCRAPLIAILEGDDTWPADKLERLVPAFGDPEIVLAYGLTVVVGEGRHDFPPTIPSAAFERQFPAGTLENTPVGRAAVAMLDYRGLTFTYPCSVILRRAALERIGGFQHREGLIVTDHPTFLRLALEGRFHFERRPMGYWRVHRAGTTVQHMDYVLGVLHRDIQRFHAEFGQRLGITPPQWREIERMWRVAGGWMSLRHARRLLVGRRWREARPHLTHALSVGRWTTAATALAGLVASRLHLSVEPIYRLRRRPWFRRDGAGAILVVTPDHRPP